MSNTHGDIAGAQWRTSSRSGGAQQCVEVATNVTDVALIRDSKLGDESPVMTLSPRTFAAFIEATKSGKFN